VQDVVTQVLSVRALERTKSDLSAHFRCAILSLSNGPFLQNQRSSFDVTITSHSSVAHRQWTCPKADREAKTTRGILFDLYLELHLQTYFENR